MSTLHVPASIYEAMVEHCVAGLPNEACGFLAGRDGKVERIYPLDNEAASPVYYRPAGRQMLDAMNEIDAGDLELLSIFHSHVASAAYPSPTDVREARYPEAVYLIVSLADRDSPRARGFHIRKADWRDETGEVLPVELVIT